MFVLLLAAAQLRLIALTLNWRLSLDELAYIVNDAGPEVIFHDHAHTSTANSLASAPVDHAANLQMAAATVTRSDDTAAPAGRAIKVISLEYTDAQSLHQRRGGFPVTELPAMGVASAMMPAAPDIDATPALLVYTSGTTGRPKGALLSQRAMVANAIMSQHMTSLSADDKVLNVLPLFHVGGINIQSLPALMHGATLVLHQSFDPLRCLAAIAQHRITLMVAVPTVLQALIAQPAWSETSIESLRSVAIGSTDVPLPLIEAVHARGVPVVQVYGATETGPICIYQLAEHARSTAGSIGRAGLLCEIALLGQDGAVVADGEPGEICLRGDNTLTRYWNQAEATATAFSHGWFHTGDVARCDNEGNYWFHDRIKHVIISGGENIYPAEIERVLRQLPAVLDVAVVGRQHERWGEVPVAVIAVGDELANMLQHPQPLVTAAAGACESNLARFKRPREIHVVADLPRNALGKVLVQNVRETVLRSLPPGSNAADSAAACYQLL